MKARSELSRQNQREERKEFQVDETAYKKVPAYKKGVRIIGRDWRGHTVIGKLLKGKRGTK